MKRIRIPAFLLCICMLVSSFASCGKKDTSSDTSASSDVSDVSSSASSEDESIYPIEVGMTPEEEAQTITNLNTVNKVNGEDPKIASDYALVQDFDPDWAYSHQSAICVFKDKIYAAWSSGIQDEDFEGQRVMMSYASVSNFNSWSKPVCLAEPGEGMLHDRLLLNGEMFTDGDTLYITYTEKELDPSLYDANGNIIRTKAGLGQDLTYCYSEQLVIESKDGKTWSEPYSLNECKAYQSDDSALYLRLASNGCTSATIADAELRGAPMLVENYVYKSANGVWHVMSRTGLDRLWSNASYDGGKTWSSSYPTQFSTAATMATFGNLPDGRAFFIGSVTYDIRYPLSLYVSEDGYNFDKGYTLRDEIYKMQKDGWAKGGDYAYADYSFDDTYMYIIYTKQKETVEVTRVKLSDIL